jgi:hypothetical protein
MYDSLLPWGISNDNYPNYVVNVKLKVLMLVACIGLALTTKSNPIV